MKRYITFIPNYPPETSDDTLLHLFNDHLLQCAGTDVNRIHFLEATSSNLVFETPRFAINLSVNRLEMLLRAAFISSNLQEGRDYLREDNCIIPVRFNKHTQVPEKMSGTTFANYVQELLCVRLGLPIPDREDVKSALRKYAGTIFGVTGTVNDDRDDEYKPVSKAGI
ncbi:MAG: hypothetical protein ACRCXC_10655 [Legionella sp.]